jgi:hypothetical protein
MASGLNVARGVARSQKPREAHIVQESLKNELRKRYSDFGIKTEAHLEIAMARSETILEKGIVAPDSKEIAEFVRTQYGGLFGAEPGTVAATPPTATHAPSTQKPQQSSAPKGEEGKKDEGKTGDQGKDSGKPDAGAAAKKDAKPVAPKKENKKVTAPAATTATEPKADGTAEAPKA